MKLTGKVDEDLTVEITVRGSTIDVEHIVNGHYEKYFGHTGVTDVPGEIKKLKARYKKVRSWRQS